MMVATNSLPSPHAMKVPAVYEWREFVDAGGLLSYGANLKDTYRQIGVYAARILKGAKPARSNSRPNLNLQSTSRLPKS